MLNLTLADGSLLVKGKNVTGFSKEEEQLAELDKYVPFLTETELVSRGALYKKADKPWASFAIEDHRLITGQNPASGGAVADLLIAALRANGCQDITACAGPGERVSRRRTRA